MAAFKRAGNNIFYRNPGKKSADRSFLAIEDAYILAWALNIIAEKPAAGKAATSEQLDDLLDKVPSLGMSWVAF